MRRAASEHLRQVADDHQEAPAGFQQMPDARIGRIADVVHDEIVADGVSREVAGGVVDHVIGAERADQIGVGGAADTGHLGAALLGELHGHHADRAGGTVDENVLARLQLRAIEEGSAP